MNILVLVSLTPDLRGKRANKHPFSTSLSSSSSSFSPPSKAPINFCARGIDCFLRARFIESIRHFDFCPSSCPCFLSRSQDNQLKDPTDTFVHTKCLSGSRPWYSFFANVLFQFVRINEPELPRAQLPLERHCYSELLSCTRFNPRV